MQVIPVIDVQQGVAVHAVAGERARYRPIDLAGIESPTPLALARWYEQHFGLRDLYVADLSAIGGATPAWTAYRELARSGFTLTLDLGQLTHQRAEQARPLVEDPELRQSVTGVVLGLESLTEPSELQRHVERFGTSRAAFSLDLIDGRPFSQLAELRDGAPERIVERAFEAGFRRLIVLDLRRVGMGQGMSVLDLCKSVCAKFPDLEVTSGGGVRGVADLWDLRRSGCRRALVATALLRQQLSSDDLQQIGGQVGSVLPNP